MKLTVINTGTFKLDGGAMFGVVPKKIWSKLNQPDENNLCTWSMRCLLVEMEDKKILIDCGMGNKQDAKFFSHYEPSGIPTTDDELRRINLSSDEITDVFLTHLHFDHCGGAIKYDAYKNLVPAFAKANYWCNQKQWDWAINPNQREKASFLKENILPIQETGRLNMVPTEKYTEVFKGFRIYFVYGHTEAMMLPMITYNGKTICYMADLLPSAAHLPLPYVMGYDMRPLVTLQEKEAFLNEAVEKDYYLYFEHDKDNELCNLQKTDKGVRVKEFFKMSEL